MSYTKSEETKAQLVKTMSRLLRTQGYHATGISQVLSESGVPKGSLYYHFPGGKVELAAAAVRRSQSKITSWLERFVAEGENPAALVGDFCDWYIHEMARSDFQRGCPLATVTLEASSVEPIQIACDDAFAAMEEILTAQLAACGVEADEASRLSIITIAAIEGALVLSRARRSVEPLATVRDFVVPQIRAALPFEQF